MSKRNSILGPFILLIAAFVWGTSFVAQRMATSYMDSLAYNATRVAIGSVLLFFIIIIKDTISKKTNKKIIPFNKSTIFGGIILGVCIFFATTTQQIGLETTSAGKSGFITALYVAFVPIIGLLARKKTPIIGWIAIPIALLGFALMSITDDFTVAIGDAITLMCAILFSLHILFLDIYGEHADPIKITFVQFFVAAIIGLIWMGAEGTTPTPTQFVDCIGPLLYVGLLSCGVAYTCQAIGQKMVPPALSTLIMSLESVVALVSGSILLNESVTPKEAIGSVIVFIAVILAEQTPYKVFLDNDIKR